MEKDKSLFQLCQQALDQTIANDMYYGGIAIDKVVENLNDLTSAAEWPKDLLFDYVVRSYIASIANQAGMRAGIKRKGVYFSENTENKTIAGGLYRNESDLAASYSEKAKELKETYLILEKTTDGQMGFQNPDMNIIEERSVNWLSDYIKELSRI